MLDVKFNFLSTSVEELYRKIMKISPYPPIYEVVQEKNDVRVIFETLEEEDVNESIFITLHPVVVIVITWG